jgi:Zn finger protein HypA/HybF involved in hydrogenase expression
MRRKNRVQFQKGMSWSAFRVSYGTEELCRAALEAMRWPGGFVCPNCGGSRQHKLKRRALVQCADCHQQVSLTAGTIFHATKLPLANWFQAIYLITQS